MNTSWITQAVYDFVTSNSGLLLAEGSNWLRSLAIIMLVVLGIRVAVGSTPSALAAFLHFGTVFLIAVALLHYYSTPLPFAGVSVHQLLPETARQIAAKIDQSALQDAVNQLNHLIDVCPMPAFPFHPIEIVTYLLFIGAIWCMQGLMFALNSVGFIAVGIGVVLGPLFIPWLVVPRLSWLFWNWISYMVSWSFFQVVASALVSVWSHAIIAFINATFNGEISLGQGFALVAPLILLTLAMAWTCLQSERLASSLFGNAVGSVGGFGLATIAAARGALS